MERRRLLREQAPPPPPPPPPPAGDAAPPAPASPAPATSPDEPKKLTPEQEKSLKSSLKEIKSCSLDKGTKEGPFTYENEKYFFRAGDKTKYTKDFWCRKED